MYITYHKIVFLVLSTLTCPPILNKEFSININNHNLYLISFTLETINIVYLKTLFNFNHPDILSEFPFYYNTPSCYLSLIDSEGNLFGHYELHLNNPSEDDIELLLVDIMNIIFKDCVYYSMINNVSTNNYIFYMHISKNNIMEK
jgi:hypothetical protein